MLLVHHEPLFIGPRSSVQLWLSMECDKPQEFGTKHYGRSGMAQLPLKRQLV